MVSPSSPFEGGPVQQVHHCAETSCGNDLRRITQPFLYGFNRINVDKLLGVRVPYSDSILKYGSYEDQVFKRFPSVL